MNQSMIGLVLAVAGIILLVPLSVLLIVPETRMTYTVSVNVPPKSPVLVLNRVIVVFQDEVDCRVVNTDDDDEDCLDEQYVSRQRARTILAREGIGIIEQQDNLQYLVSLPVNTYQQFLDTTDRLRLLPYVRTVQWVYE